MNRWFLDTEFYDTGKEIELISIALVGERCGSYYAANIEFEPTLCEDKWIHENVIPKLPHATSKAWRTRDQIRGEISSLLKHASPSGNNELWGYFSAYDYVLLCQLYGGMLKMPPHIPHRCNDIAQLAASKGVTKQMLPVQTADSKHNALDDAIWNRDAYLWIVRN